MKFRVGCDMDEFKGYYRACFDLHRYFKTRGVADAKLGELGAVEDKMIRDDPSHLIVWRDNDDIIGHAIWHETSTDDHREGDPRDKEDRTMLRGLLGGKKSNIAELHEVWLKSEHRGNGYGKKFFEFFENFVRGIGYESIVYYTDHFAAAAICRKRGYKEGLLEKEKWQVFCLSL